MDAVIYGRGDPCRRGRQCRGPVVVCTAMGTPPVGSVLGELRVLLATTITRASEVTDLYGTWDTPRAHSPAGKELAAEEARRPDPQAGSWPWQLAPMIASWALQVAAEEARGFSAALDRDATSCAADVLCRAVLETSSLAWWLLAPDIDTETRLARSLVYRLQSAGHTRHAIKALDLGPGDSPAGYGELPEHVKRDINDAGLTWERRQHGGRQVLFCGEECWPSYTERAAGLVAEIWPQRKLPYAVLSAVAHGELLGLQRNLAPTPRGAGLRVAPGPATALWLWQDTYLVTGALVFTAGRAAAFLGLHDQLAAIDAWTAELNHRLPALRPSVP